MGKLQRCTHLVVFDEFGGSRGGEDEFVVAPVVGHEAGDEHVERAADAGVGQRRLDLSVLQHAVHPHEETHRDLARPHRRVESACVDKGQV